MEKDREEIDPSHLKETDSRASNITENIKRKGMILEKYICMVHNSNEGFERLHEVTCPGGFDYTIMCEEDTG